MKFRINLKNGILGLWIVLGFIVAVLALNGCAGETKGDQGPEGECDCDISRAEFDALVERITALETLLGSCSSNDQCSSGEYCSKENGDCNDTGNCQEKPEICPDVWDPVCGCDNNTYGNACSAAEEGVNIDYNGQCQ